MHHGALSRKTRQLVGGRPASDLLAQLYRTLHRVSGEVSVVSLTVGFLPQFRSLICLEKQTGLVLGCW